MRRSTVTRRLHSAYTLFNRLLALRERSSGTSRTMPDRRAWLSLQAMEERIVLDGRPLPDPQIFLGSDSGRAPLVQSYNAETGVLQFAVTPYGPDFLGGVRVGTGDFTGDGTPDVVVAPGAGRSGMVRIFDGKTGEQIAGPLGSFQAYAPWIRSGVYVAAADVNYDGHVDVITAATIGTGPKVKVFDGVTGSLMSAFFVRGQVFADGITIAAGNLTGDPKAEVVVGGSADGKVRTYDPLTGTIVSGPLGSFRAFGPSYTGGVFVGADAMTGDVDGDFHLDLALGTTSGTPRVRVLSGATGKVIEDFRPFGSNASGGARVALAYVDDDKFADVIAGTGSGPTSAVRVFSGATGQTLAAPLGEYKPFGGTQNGTFVAASNDPITPLVIFNQYASSAATGQVTEASVSVQGTIFPAMLCPTGTVTFTASDGTNNYTVGTITLVSDGSGYNATATIDYGSLPAGTYTLTATYNGDSNFGTGSDSVSVSVSDSSGTPPNYTLGSEAISSSGVKYGSGMVALDRTDLSSNGFGAPWTLTWSWTNVGGYSDGIAGVGSTLSQTPHLVQVNGDDSIALIVGAGYTHFFDYFNSAYHARFDDTSTMTHDTVNHVFTVKDDSGQTLTFYDFSGFTPSGRAGKFKSLTDPNGGVTQVTTWGTNGEVDEVQRTSGSGSSQLTESFLYTYIASGTNAGLLDTVTQRTKIGTGSWSTVRSADYDYYDGTSGPGLAGDLKLATVKDASGNAIDTSYYRYYTSGTGSTGNIKYVFGAEAYARLTADLGTGVDSLTDGQVDDYADRYFTYDSSGRVATVTNSAASGSPAGQFSYSYTANSNAGLHVTNEWATKTVETLPDGSTNTVYTNSFGQVMLNVFDDVNSSGTWDTYTRYDDAGRTILEAAPSAVTGYSDSYNDLVHYSSGNAQYLDDSNGLITTFEYGSSTTATTSTAGDAAGYLKEVDIQHGETGSAVPQEALDYLKNTVTSTDFFHLADDTVYRNDDGTGGQTTSYAYTYFSGTNQVESTTVTLPTVTTAQNGSNSATSYTVVNDAFGRPIWTNDQGGFLTYIQYDTLTGAVVKTITDVDTTQSSDFADLPSGWSTPSGGGKHLITTYAVDALGRVTKTTSPEGRVDYTVYDDADHEVRMYSGWDSTNHVATGPTTVVREDRANGYVETLTMSATPALDGSNLPTGGESISKVQSLSRSYFNDAGQVTQTDDYFNLAGLTYSTSTSLGTEGTNFYRTQYGYDADGNLDRTVSPQGTIYRTVYDGQGRPVSEWVGTDDTPTSGDWSPSNLTGTDMVEVRSYEYDGGGVGDGNLTKVTDIPGGSAADRVTQGWYDWRDRLVAVKGGVEASESTSVNRPLFYYDYDNRGEVTKTRMYDADGQTPTITSGVPQPLSSSLLRAQTTTSYDELGRAYRSEVYSVDPSSGSVGSNTLKSDTWFDSRGNVIKQTSPGGLVQKMTYDGAGLNTASYLTDGGGDSGYSDASTVTGDTVLEQTEVTYSDDGLVLSTLTRQRFHDASGTGALGDPSSGIGARVSYMGYYYDAASGRLTAAVDVGTNGGSSWTRPGSVPSRSDTALVTSFSYAADALQVVKLTGSPTGGTFTLSFGGQTTSAIAYNASSATVQSNLEALSSIGSGNMVVSDAAGGGWEIRFAGSLAGKYQTQLTGNGANLTGGTSPSVAISTISQGGDTGQVAETTDPAGIKSRSYSDALGRTTRTVEDFVDGVVSDSDDKITDYAYNGAGMTSLKAHLTGGGVQTTAWIYGVTQGSGSAITSNDIVGKTDWPDPSTGAASSSEEETTTVNALGETLTATDRNGNVHTLTYDVLGRVVSDAVTTLGSGVDGSVRRIDTAYDGQGNAYLITSYDAASGGSIVNQVQRAFNGLGQMTTEWQQHGAAVNTSTSPEVQYAYSEMSGGANHSRLTSITYPSGYVLTFNYSSGLNDSISRLSSLSDSSGTLESYDYLGLSTVVRRAHSQPGVDLTYIKQSGESNGDAGDQYTGLDRFGRVVDQRWIKTSSGTATDRFQYGYDRDSNRLWRDNLVNNAFGELYSYDGLNQLASFDRGTLNGTKTGLTGSASRSQDWNYDALGNWDSVTTDGSTETRSANKQNEITSISGATTPTFDANGNMTGDETGRQFVYDAWNRLVTVKDSGGSTLETFSYDGVNQRVTETASGTTTDLFYSDQWQVLEEKIGSNTTKRYVWSPVYVDAMILRDRDTDGNGTLDERLWVHQDANFNVTALVDGNGSVVERYAYDAFGVRTVNDASYNVRSGGSSYDFQHGFQGMGFDAISGLNVSRLRPGYSPTLGRWVQADPISFAGGDVNLYRSSFNNSVNVVDPSGTQPPGSIKRKPTKIILINGIKPLPAPPKPIPPPGFMFAGGIKKMPLAPPEFNPLASPKPPSIIAGTMAGMAGTVAPGTGVQSTWGGFPGVDRPAAIEALQHETASEARTNYVWLPLGIAVVSSGGAIWVMMSEGGHIPAPGGLAPGKYQDLLADAQAQYPKLAGKIQKHHITPQFLGGPASGPTVELDAAYHQLITNEFRTLWPYGSGQVPTAQVLQRIMQQVYSKYPLP